MTPDESPADVRRALGAEQTLPAAGTDAGRLVSDATGLLFDHSLFNGHPRFFGYITSSPAPIGMFGDFLAAALNQNVGAWRLAPLATEIEGQAVRWIAELIGFPTSCGGLLVSGGNMANFVCFVAARAAKAPWDVRKEGLSRDGTVVAGLRVDGNPHAGSRRPPTCSGSAPTRSAGLPPTTSSGWIRRRCAAQIEQDLRLGHQPVSRRRHRGLGQHRRRRSAAGDRRHLP